MIQKNLADPPAISPEQEARGDLDDRSAADDFMKRFFNRVMLNVDDDEVEEILYKIYHLSNNDELLAINDLKSLLFNKALELVKRGK